MKRIAIDMDEVIADFIPEQLKRFQEVTGKRVTMEDLHGTKLKHIHKDKLEIIHTFQNDPTFFRHLNVIPDSQEVLQTLSKDNEIFITTAAMEFPGSFTAKYEWLKEHFPFLDDMNFVFCGDKSIIHADYLIDDNVRHFKNFRGKGIIFTAPHNINEQGFDRLANWKEALDYFQSNE